MLITLFVLYVVGALCVVYFTFTLFNILVEIILGG